MFLCALNNNCLAVDLAKEQKLNYGDEMTSILRQARKRCFQLREERRIAQDIELQSYLNQLIVEDAERNIAALKEQEVTKETNGKTEGEAASDIFTRKKEEVEEDRDTCMARLNDLFEKVDERRRVSFFYIILFNYAYITNNNCPFVVIWTYRVEEGST